MRFAPHLGWTAFGLLFLAVLVVFTAPLPADGTDFPVASGPTIISTSALAAATSQAMRPVSTGVLNASTLATAQARRCSSAAQAIEEARQLHFYRRHAEADALLTLLLDGDCLEEAAHRDQARFQHAYLLLQLDEPQRLIERLQALEADTPVSDYIHWLFGEAYQLLERPVEAAQHFQAIYDAGDSPLHWKARARQAFNLAATERWDEALPLLEQIVELFPDFPRRHRALLLRAQALQALGQTDKAALAYQQTYFEFPFKAEGQLAAERLDELAEEGIEPPAIHPDVRFAKYRQLSIDKFWPLAHDLLSSLRQDVATETGDSLLENRILERLALNAYHSQNYPDADTFFAQARNIIESGGNTQGFSNRVIYRYHSFTLAILDRHDEAIEALEVLHKNGPPNAGLEEIAAHYERQGQYEEAFQIYDSYFSAWQKRAWHYSYLLYKTGRLEEAYENLQSLAMRSRGETRAKYLYWAGRSLERAGNNDEAAQVFSELNDSLPTSYYGIQAANRLLDLQQRQPPDEAFVAQTDLRSLNADQALDAIDDAYFFASQATPISDHDPRTQPIALHLDNLAADSLVNHNPFSTARCITSFGCEDHLISSPFLSYGGSWSLRRALLDPALPHLPSSVTRRAALASASEESLIGLDRSDSEQPRVPRADIDFADELPRVRFHTEARIYWNGRRDSDIAFVNYGRGQMIGPTPSSWTAYADDEYIGGLQRAIDQAGELFPNLERSQWLWLANWNSEARRVIRDVSLEYRALSSRSRARSAPHELPEQRWEYYIDNRRRQSRAQLWGLTTDEPRFPVPDSGEARQALLERQQRIYDERNELRPLLVDAFREVGDFHFVRRHALRNTWWLAHEPAGDALPYWSMAYPRAFPEKVIPLAQQHNINPYMIWALMLVESSFNPDSLSVADAMGLLQVIPRTGLKIADLFGSQDFGPFDLLEEDHSIEQGIFYFSRLVQKFHGQELFAFAGYNGGPHRVAGWLDMRGQRIPHDEFIEEIPFDQSRNYAKKVLRFLNVYLRIYEGYDEGLYIGQNVRPDYLPQPNF